MVVRRDHPLTKEAEDSGYEIGVLYETHVGKMGVQMQAKEPHVNVKNV